MLVRARDVLCWGLDALYYSVGILISLPLNLLLNVFGVVGRQAIGLELEVVVEFGQVLDEVVDRL